MKILVVEDEFDMCDAIAEGLELSDYAVTKCHDGETAFELILDEDFDAVILDLNLPKMDGLEVLQKIRAKNNQTKVLILSARASVSDKVLGLDMTANDYLAKPFDFDELLARLRNLTRTNFVQQSVVLSAKNLSFNTATRDVFLDGVEVNLTKREKSILEYLLLNKGSVVQTKKLIDKIWDFSADNAENSLRVHIASLKKKLQIDLIKNKIGEGYYIE